MEIGKTMSIVGDTACPNCVEQGGDKTGNHLMLFEDGGFIGKYPLNLNTLPSTYTVVSI